MFYRNPIPDFANNAFGGILTTSKETKTSFGHKNPSIDADAGGLNTFLISGQPLAEKQGRYRDICCLFIERVQRILNIDGSFM